MNTLYMTVDQMHVQWFGKAQLSRWHNTISRGVTFALMMSRHFYSLLSEDCSRIATSCQAPILLDLVRASTL